MFAAVESRKLAVGEMDESEGPLLAMRSEAFAIDLPSFQLYFNEPRILSSRGDTQTPGYCWDYIVLDISRCKKKNEPFQYSFPQAFPCFPSFLNTARVTTQYELAIYFSLHRVWWTSFPTGPVGVRDNTS